jgi:3-deoxy-D-arabino-heptulosonate 7-phosphate (DAHP) synthase class II
VQAAPQLGAAYDEAATRLNQLRATAEAGKAKLQ